MTQNGGSRFLPTFLTYRAQFELSARQLPPAEADLHRALVDLLSTRARPGEYSAYVGRAELILAQALSSESKVDEAQLAAEQIARAEGPDHHETMEAVRIGQLPRSVGDLVQHVSSNLTLLQLGCLFRRIDCLQEGPIPLGQASRRGLTRFVEQR